MKKFMMVEEGDIGLVFSVVKMENNEGFDCLLENGFIEYKDVLECGKEFGELVGELEDGELLDLFNNYLSRLNYEGEKREVEWFVGSNGEYVSILGFVFDDVNNELGEFVIDNELLVSEVFGDDRELFE